MNGKTPPRQLAEQAIPGLDSNNNPAMAAVEAWMSFNRPMLAAVTELNGRFFDQVSKANNELLGFVSRRINEDMATSNRIMECCTVHDLLSCCSEYFERAQSQYQAEFQNFARFNQNMAEETARIMKNRVEQMGAEVRH